MELDIDLPAWLNYCLVLAISVYSSVGEVDTRLKDVRGKWAFGETYVLFLLFATLPILVFWLLDRANAIHDVSLFSTMLVALSYQAIVKGTSTTTHAGVTAIGKPLLDWSDRIVDQLGNLLKQSDSDFATEVLNGIGEDGITKLDSLVTEVRQNVPDQLTFDERLSEYDATNAKPAGPLELRRWAVEKARRALFFVKPGLHVRIVFLRRGLIRHRAFWTYVLSPARFARVVFPTLLLLLISLTTWKSLSSQINVSVVERDIGVLAGTRESQVIAYYQWRFLKPHNTDGDIDRAKAFFRTQLDCELDPSSEPCSKQAPLALSQQGKQRPKIYGPLMVAMLQRPTLTREQAKRILDIMLSGRLASKQAACPVLLPLAEAMRTANLEAQNLVRETITGSIVVLGGEVPKSDDKSISQSGSVPENEKRVRQWTTLVQATCASHG